jgi:PAS domain S-box-containing protein
MPITVFILGLFSIGLLLWTNEISKSQRMDFDVSEAVADIQTKIVSSHVHLEEGISGNTSMDIERISREIDQAISLAEAILNGGESEHGMPLQPLKDSKLRGNVQDILSLLTQFKTIALQRIQITGMGRLDPDVYEHFHAVHKEIQDKAKTLEIVLETNQIRAQAKTNRLYWRILVVWISIMAVSIAGLVILETQRRNLAKGLQKVNKQLEAQAGELTKYKESLEDLVKKRTLQLVTSNSQLEEEVKEREETEKSLRISMDRFKTLVENLPLGIFLKDTDSAYLYWNGIWAKDLKMNSHEVFGKTDYDFYPRELAQRHIEEDRRILESGKAEEIEERYVKDGQEVVIQKIKVPIKNARGDVTSLLGIEWDITEKLRFESIAATVTTMNNLGYVFSGIRHEIGNPFNSIKLTLGIIGNKIDTCPKEEIKKYIEWIAADVSRVDYLLRVLKNFNMYDTLKLQNVVINTFMEKFLLLLTHDFGKRGITIESILTPEAQWGYADPRALQQVMLNIVNNAVDALEGKENPRIVVHVLKAGNTIRIKVTDNGYGIPEEQKKRVFTPFFTTKTSGTGLGLIIAKKLLSSMNGTIEIESQKDAGTSVEISIQEGRDEH